MSLRKPIRYLAGALLGAILAILAPVLNGQEKPSLGDDMKAFQATNVVYAAGVKHFERKETAKAEAAFEDCVRAIPGHAFARYYLANILYIRKDYAGALAQMEASLADYDGMIEMCEQADKLSLENMDNLLRDLQSAAGRTPTCRTSRSLEFFESRLADGEIQVQNASKRRSQERARIKAHYVYFCGNILLQLRRYADAAGRYEEALRIDPGHADAYNNLAAVYYLARAYPDALAVLDRAEANGIEDALNLKLKEAVYLAAGRPAAGILQEDIPPGREGGPAVARFALGIRQAGSALPPFYENAYLVYDPEGGDAVLIDPGIPDERIRDFAVQRKLAVKAVLNTHGHGDHVGGNRHFAGLFKAPVFAPEDATDESAGKPDRNLRDGEALDCGRLRVEVIATPGHTPGSVCFRVGDCLFSGDALFRNDIGAIGAADEKDAPRIKKAMIERIRDRLLTLPEDTRVFPGHGRASSIADQKKDNPALK